MVNVTPDDRNAALPFMGIKNDASIYAFENGEFDSSPTVQAFAAHRISTEEIKNTTHSSEIEVLRARIEKMRNALRLIAIVEQSGGGNFSLEAIINSAVHQAKQALIDDDGN